MTVLELLVNIDVDDLGAAERFYCAAFGLAPGRRLGPNVVELRGASSAIYLLAKSAGTRANAASGQTRSYDRHWTPVHLDFIVPDIEAALRSAEAAGAKREGAVATHKWGRIVQMADPFGHGFCLIEFLGRGYDEIAAQGASRPTSRAGT